jgi:hypothetical protein
VYRRVQFEYPPNTKTSYQNFEGSIFEYARIQAALPNRLVGGLLEGLTSISHTIQRAVTLSPASGLRGGVAARSRRARSPRAVAARHQAPNTRRRALRQISTPPRPPDHDHSSQPKMCQRTSAKTPPNTAPRTKKSRLIAGITWNSIARNSPAICSGVLTPPVRGTGERERASTLIILAGISDANVRQSECRSSYIQFTYNSGQSGTRSAKIRQSRCHNSSISM